MSTQPTESNVLPISTNKLSADFTIVTPTMAREWLGFNENNRNVRSLNVRMFARDISSNAWVVTGQAVQFDRDGRLIDGQHRLLAIVKADRPVMLLVVRGLDPRAQSVIDAGAKRSAGDALKFAGVKGYVRVASLARLCLVLEAGSDDPRNGAGYSNSDIDRYRLAHPEVEQAVHATYQLTSGIPMNPTNIAYCWMRLCEVDPGDCADFFEAMANYATEGRGDPRNTLLLKLRDAEAKGIRLSARDQISYTFRAWNYWRRGESLSVIKAVKDKSIPEPR